MKAQKGQALTELALVAPLFAALMLLFAFAARLAVQQLALVQLSRDAALMLARHRGLWGQTAPVQEAAVRRLAERQEILDPQRLRLSYEKVAPLGLDSVEGLEPLLQSPWGGGLQDLVAFRRYHLSYDLAPQGLWAKVFPRGLRLRETLVVHGDPWKMQASQLMEKLLR